MERYLLPSIYTAAAGSFLVLSIYVFLYRSQKKDYLLYWSIAWFFYGLRFLLSAQAPDTSKFTFWTVSGQIAAHLSGVFLFFGTGLFLGRTLFFSSLALGLSGILWILVAWFMKLSFAIAVTPIFLVLGLIFIALGVVVIKLSTEDTLPWSNLTGVIFILWGLHKINFPILRPVQWFAPYGFLIGTFLGFIASVSLLLMQFQRNLKSLENAEKKAWQAEEKSRYERDLISSITNTSPGPILVFNSKGELTFANLSAESLPGITPIIGKLPHHLTWKFLPPDSDIEISDQESPVSKALRGHNISMDRIDILDEAGRRNLSISTATICDSAGIVTSVVMTVNDLTEEIEKAERQKILEIELRHSEKLNSLGLLTGGVAHDYNNHLTGILGCAELLTERVQILGIKDSDIDSNLKMIVSMAQTSSELTSRVLTFARKDSPEFRLVNPDDLVSDVFEMLKHTLISTIAIEKKLASGGYCIMGERSQLYHALVNLAVNSRDAIDGTGFIRFETDVFKEENGCFVRISVIDNGVGMTSEVLARATEPFYTTKGPGRGTGMGLNMVREIVASHKGTLKIDSVSGEGTKITLSIPALEEPSSEGDTPETQKVMASETLRTGQVCIIDDEIIIRKMISRMISKFGYTVSFFGEIRDFESYSLHADVHPEIIIADLTMPGVSGIQVARIIRDKFQTTNIVIMTGSMLSDDEQGELKALYCSLLQKPFRKVDLLDAIARARDFISESVD
ncbi:MAG: hypothetical protein CVV64_11235 [Candidatus Wallbacteria bacterium HGW-Wallbacteria-1]|jgi:signal transduction histidine kinase/ActR/RegA family two-component response regulator|uniref:histidine kinase n=1 Tax=Candidatus Wallbacteria bacterium HGW-Wallbacteria-1 TaxID=2013854 RepID=A0A2N1PP21_9BACT|nr:MAG: hypothetical protein CVV64_11235 [Candidatus Wallbacteria bacterium HGW-Wallbacteria-1]